MPKILWTYPDGFRGSAQTVAEFVAWQRDYLDWLALQAARQGYEAEQG